MPFSAERRTIEPDEPTEISRRPEPPQTPFQPPPRNSYINKGLTAAAFAILVFLAVHYKNHRDQQILHELAELRGQMTALMAKVDAQKPAPPTTEDPQIKQFLERKLIEANLLARLPISFEAAKQYSQYAIELANKAKAQPFSLNSFSQLSHIGRVLTSFMGLEEDLPQAAEMPEKSDGVHYDLIGYNQNYLKPRFTALTAYMEASLAVIKKAETEAKKTFQVAESAKNPADSSGAIEHLGNISYHANEASEQSAFWFERFTKDVAISPADQKKYEKLLGDIKATAATIKRVNENAQALTASATP